MFLSLMAGGALAASLPSRAGEQRTALSAWAEQDDNGRRRFFAGRLDGKAIELPARGHALLAHPRASRIAYVCARRPGAYLLRFDALTGSILHRLDVDDVRRFEGHAVFDIARNRILVTESELERGEGRVGVYDADSLARIDEWPTHGIGPHELIMLERDVFAVANGGILTLPETGRIKRNLDTMEPSLALFDARDGHRLDIFALPNHKLSIRHLARAADGTLGVAVQDEAAGAAPLLALLRAGTMRLVDADAALAPRLGGYAASVAVCGDRFAVTCTRGDRVAVWDTRGRFRGAVAMRKPAGIAAFDHGWLVSNEFGELVSIRAGDLSIVARSRASGRAWDNHLAPGG